MRSMGRSPVNAVWDTTTDLTWRGDKMEILGKISRASRGGCYPQIAFMMVAGFALYAPRAAGRTALRVFMLAPAIFFLCGWAAAQSTTTYTFTYTGKAFTTNANCPFSNTLCAFVPGNVTASITADIPSNDSPTILSCDNLCEVANGQIAISADGVTISSNTPVGEPWVVRLGFNTEGQISSWYLYSCYSPDPGVTSPYGSVGTCIYTAYEPDSLGVFDGFATITSNPVPPSCVSLVCSNPPWFAGSIYNVPGTWTLASVQTGTKPPLQITTASLPSATNGQPYPSTPIMATGGSGSGYTWCVQSGTQCVQSGPPLPAGFTLSPAGVLTWSGSPVDPAGSYPFTLQVADSAGNLATQELTLLIPCPVTVNTSLGPPTGIPTSVTLTFNSPNSMTLADYAASCGYSGFDWVQTMTQEPNPSGVYAENDALSGSPAPLTPQWLDPPLGGYTFQFTCTSFTLSATGQPQYLPPDCDPTGLYNARLNNNLPNFASANPFYYSPLDLGPAYVGAQDTGCAEGHKPDFPPPGTSPYHCLMLGTCSLEPGCQIPVSTDPSTLKYFDAPHNMSCQPTASCIGWQTQLVGLVCPSTGQSCTSPTPSTPLWQRSFQTNFNGTVGGGFGGLISEGSSEVFPPDPGSGTGGITVVPTTPTMTVTPSVYSITAAQAVSVTVAVNAISINQIPTGSVTLTGGGYTSDPTPLTNGAAAFTISAGSLTAGTDTLTANYTPDTANSSTYNGASGSAAVTVTSTGMTTPTVMVTASSSSITTAQALSVIIAVNGGTGNPTPTGTVTLTSGSYTSAPATLSGGSATINVPAGSLATGTDALTANYTPDNASSLTYNTASGTGMVTVTAANCGSALPITTASVSGTVGSGGWYRSPVLVTLSATDASSTIVRTLFTLDGAAQATYAAPFTVSSNGVHQLSFYSVDACGNTETPKTIQVQIDQTPPTIACSLNPLPNANGWNNTPVTVSFAASDAVSGVASVSPSVTLTGQGAKQAVSGMATDNAGNTASVTCVANIDLTPPEAYLQFDLASKDVDLYGTDALSDVAPGPMAPLSVQAGTPNGNEPGDAELRTYEVFDLAGNSLLLKVNVIKNENYLMWQLLSLQYQGNPALVPSNNQARIEWVLGNGGALETLAQEIGVGSGKGSQLVIAQFESTKNLTVIQQSEGGISQRPVEKPGLDLLRLATQAGKLLIQY